MMSHADIWWSILGLTVITVAVRTTFLLLPARFQLPPRLQRGLRYAPPCALVAIIAPDLLLGPQGTLFLSFTNIKLLAAIVACAVFLATRKIWLMILAGMGAFTLLRLTLT